MSSKRIGILGGLGPLATADQYLAIVPPLPVFDTTHILAEATLREAVGP